MIFGDQKKFLILHRSKSSISVERPIHNNKPSLSSSPWSEERDEEIKKEEEKTDGPDRSHQSYVKGLSPKNELIRPRRLGCKGGAPIFEAFHLVF